jgi:outer membrane beta-barrel protein
MKKTILLLVALVTTCTVASTAVAAVQGGEITITPFVGGYTFDGIQHLETNFAAGLGLGYNLTKHWGVEGRFTYAPLRSTAPIITTKKGDQYSLKGELLYHFMPDNRLVPFVALGGGWSRTTKLFGPENDDATIDYGGGVKYFITDWMALRGDVRHIFSFHTSNQGATDFWQNLEYTVGLTFQIPLRKNAAPVAKVEEAKAAPAPVPAPVPTPVEAKAEVPAPVPAPMEARSAAPAATGPNELLLQGRLPSAAGQAPALEAAPAPGPPAGWEGPTSWMAEKTDVPEGKILVVGYKVAGNSLEIIATDKVPNYKVYTLAQPSRLVIDITNGLNGFRTNNIPISRLGIATVRMEDTPDYLRIILDAAQENLLPYRIEETEKGLKVIVTKP